MDSGNDHQRQNGQVVKASEAQGMMQEIDISALHNIRQTRTLSVGNSNNWERVFLLVRMYILVVIIAIYTILVISLIVENPVNIETIHSKCGDMDYNTMRMMQSTLILHSLMLYGAGVGGDPPNQFGYSLDQTVEEIELLHLHNKFTTFGDSSGDYIGQLQRNYISDQEYLLAFTDGCAGWAYSSPTHSECETFSSQFMSNGLTFAVTRFVHAARMAVMDFHSRKNTTATGPLPLGPYTPATYAQVNATLSNQEFSLATVLALDYTIPQLSLAVNSDLAKSQDFFQTLGTDQIMLLVAFCLASSASYFLVFQPLISSLDQNIQRTRSLLLLIPANVINSMSSIKDYVKRQQDRAT